MVLIKFSKKLFDDLVSELYMLDPDTISGYKYHEMATHLCIKYIQRLKGFLKQNPKVSELEEIQFFKEMKPQYKALLIYHQTLMNIESRKPAGDNLTVSEYYKKEFNSINYFFDVNVSFYQYVRSGATHLDSYYFQRGQFNIHLHPYEGFVDFDPDFNTSHDNKMAQLIANEKILAFIEMKLYGLSNPDRQIQQIFADINWTQTKAALVELIYSLYETKALNDGDLTIKKLANYMEKVFNISLGNFYDTYEWLSARPNQTTFIDQMKDALYIRMQKKIS